MVYLHKDKERFREAIDLVVYKTGISSQAVEKDYYVTMILKLLAEEMPFIVFKGGTSLSKCHKVIRRFSEDIDLSVDEYISQGQRKKLKQAIVKVTEMLGLEIENLEDTRSRRVYNKYIVPYQTVLFNENAALQPAVSIETSLAALAFPANVMPVSSFVGDMILEEAPQLIEEYGLDTFEMKVQQVNRTLAEKVFAICDYYLRGEVHKYSRHLYDIYKLLPHVPQDEAFRDLVAEVRRIRKGLITVHRRKTGWTSQRCSGKSCQRRSIKVITSMLRSICSRRRFRMIRSSLLLRKLLQERCLNDALIERSVWSAPTSTGAGSDTTASRSEARKC